MPQSSAERRGRTLGAHRRFRRLHHLGTDSGLLEAAQSGSGPGNSRASLCLDDAFLILLISWQGRWTEVRAVCAFGKSDALLPGQRTRDLDQLVLLHLGRERRRVIETSLGYFMTPLVNVLFGAIFLRERLTRWQLISVLLATARRSYISPSATDVSRGSRVVLCFSFGVYGLLRKKSGTRAIPGLFFRNDRARADRDHLSSDSVANTVISSSARRTCRSRFCS